MPITDNDVVIRDRAYALWEAAGRPTGREHEHWAQARRDVETQRTSAETPPSISAPVDSLESIGVPLEASRLRQALYAPEPFSFELFGDECPNIDRPIVLRRHSLIRSVDLTETRSAA